MPGYVICEQQIKLLSVNKKYNNFKFAESQNDNKGVCGKHFFTLLKASSPKSQKQCFHVRTFRPFSNYFTGSVAKNAGIRHFTFFSTIRI